MHPIANLLLTAILWVGSFFCLVSASIHVEVSATLDRVSYRVVNEHNQTIFQGGDIAAYMSGKWCVVPSVHHDAVDTAAADAKPPSLPLTLTKKVSLQGGHTLGSYTGVRLIWTCRHSSSPRYDTIVTSFLNLDDGHTVLFQLEWPQGADNTTLEDHTAAMANFPSFVMTTTGDGSGKVVSSFLPDTLSWEGSFVQSVRGLSKGPRGGPTVFYNASSDVLQTVLIGSSMGSTFPNSNDHSRIYWNTFTAGNHYDWSGTQSALSPGISGRISYLPQQFRHTYMLYEGKRVGVTAAMDEWGLLMQQHANPDKPIPDVTLDKIGIQTDNGAYYCFCADSGDHHQNCSDVLLQNKQYLDSIDIPVGYVSFQGAGTSSGRGKAAPWCVEKWSADGGQDRNHYPLDTKDFRQALGVPLQLYAPYFCPNSTYFGKGYPWQAVISNPDLPGCQDFAFETVRSEDSKMFFKWFIQKGIDAGMKSFETDFMNQNVNCVPDFIQSPHATDDFLYGMAESAHDLHIPIQWCYASPNEVFSSLSMPAVTNFRVSFDFCYGRSYDVGESSLLVWALGAAPSKDTLWSTDNNRTETPGCSWTPDHENVAAELHVVLALMSTGPFGLSDGIGMTNATLIQRVIAKDGTLLQPIKPITAVDSTFLKSTPDGYVYGTYSVGPSWIFVSFQLKKSFAVRLRDFYPPMDPHPKRPRVLAYRSFSDPSCTAGEDAVQSGCVKLVSLPASDSGSNNPTIFVAPAADFSAPGSDLSPTVTTVWHQCEDSGVIFLGELDKYVALSTKRFDNLICTDDGASTLTYGSVGEVIRVTYLVPQTKLTGEAWYQIMTLTISFSDGTIVPIEVSVPGQEEFKSKR
jgi:hypothetical protein